MMSRSARSHPMINTGLSPEDIPKRFMTGPMKSSHKFYQKFVDWHAQFKEDMATEHVSVLRRPVSTTVLTRSHCSFHPPSRGSHLAMGTSCQCTLGASAQYILRSVIRYSNKINSLSTVGAIKKLFKAKGGRWKHVRVSCTIKEFHANPRKQLMQYVCAKKGTSPAVTPCRVRT